MTAGQHVDLLSEFYATLPSLMETKEFWQCLAAGVLVVLCAVSVITRGGSSRDSGDGGSWDDSGDGGGDGGD